MRRWSPPSRNLLGDMETRSRVAGGSDCWRYANEDFIGLTTELSSLVGVSILYMATRHRVNIGPVKTPTTVSFARPGSPGLLSSYGNHVRERATRMSHSTGTINTSISSIREDLRRISPTGQEDVAEPKGAVWGTEARDYRYVYPIFLQSKD
jgi:hypothetical protein